MFSYILNVFIGTTKIYLVKYRDNFIIFHL
jgi:hypothetical protein